MSKAEIAKRLAREAGVSEAEAADSLDLLVRRILADLRKGKETPLPGLGKFTHDAEGKVAFEAERAHA